jgi:cytochrome c peroxidase
MTSRHIALLAGLATACSGDDRPPSASDATTSPDAGVAVCQTPAAEDLFPDDVDFEGGGGGGPMLDGAPPPPPPPPDAGGGPPPDGGGPTQNETCPTGGTPLLAKGHVVPNPYGTASDTILPDVDCDFRALDDFATSRLLGTNDRQCMSCHSDDGEWSSSAREFQDRFRFGTAYLVTLPRFATNDTAVDNDDLEPVFRVIDAATSPYADVSTPAAREAAYALLLTRGLFRIGLPMPEAAEFELVAVDDPYEFASAKELSLFRRSPPMTNLRFNTTVMFDGRETLACETLTTSLRHQAATAIKGHAQGATPGADDVAAIVRGELLLYTAQLRHATAGDLSEDGARGGPLALAQVPFYWGINAFDKTDPEGQAYDPEVFELYQAWRDLDGDTPQAIARRQIADGERLFNTKEFVVSGVAGFNGPGRESITATCGACHNTPDVGTNSEGLLMDLGTSSEANSADLPIYTFRATADGATVKTSDPGRALITGRWTDMNRIKVPALRALAGRAPYFHNGLAPSLEAVVAYHDQRFAIGLTAEERAALVAFLSAL